MTQVTFEISMSLDGYVAGPDPTLEDPLGKRGMELHDWVFGLDAWREAHGLEGGERSEDNAIVEESVAATGAVVMGRKMFSGGEGPWEDDSNAGGWWGDEPPFHVPVFVVTHHARAQETKHDTEITFVTDGVESAVAQAREAAGERDVKIAGGASVGQQAIAAGLVGELQIHIAPVLLGDGVRLFDRLGPSLPRLECTSVRHSPAVTHLVYRVLS